MKDFLEILHKVGLVPIQILGWISFILLGMTVIPSLNYIPKVIIYIRVSSINLAVSSREIYFSPIELPL